MKRKVHRIVLLAVLAIASATCLSLMAGPAAATDPFDGEPPAYGWHDYTAKAVWLGMNATPPALPTESYFRVESTDPRLTGDLTAYLWAWYPEDSDSGYWHVVGFYELVNDAGDGGWTGEFDHLLSTRFLEGRNHGITVGEEVLEGWGKYAGFVAHQRGHAAPGPFSYWIMKGWVEKVDD